jgi:predicted ATPase
LVLVLEDLHWSDPSTLAFLTYVSRRRDRARLLILGTYRPVDMIMQAHPLSRVLTELRQHHQCAEIMLDDLPEAAVAAYLTKRFSAQRAPEALLHLLYQRCSGNSLFLIAIVDELVRQGILQKKAQTLHVLGGLAAVGNLVPGSVQQLVAQHVGQLSPQEQILLEAASVAGMVFSVAAVEAGVTHARSDIEAQLTTWARQGRFVQAYGTETWPDGTVSACYGFRHALYHEVILRRISPGQRIDLHLSIGSRKEMAYAGQAPIIAAELAAHFEAAQDLRRAVIYRQHAAENALLRSAYEEAIAHLTQGLNLLDALPNTPERAQHELILHLALGTPLSVTKGYAAPEVERSYTRARELHQQLGEAKQLPLEVQRRFQFYLVRGVQFYLVRGDLKAAQEVGQQCLKLAVDDPTFRLAAHYALALSLFYLGEFAPARFHAEQCMALYNPQQHYALASLYGYDLGVASRGYAAQAQWILGYPDQAPQRCHEALILAQELSHPFSEAFILGHLAVLHQFGRDGHTVYERAQALTAFCTEKGFHQWMEMGIILQDWGLAVQGQGEAGIAQMRQGLTSSGDAGTGLGRAPVMAQLAEAYWIAGQTEEGLRALEQAQVAMEATGERWWAAEIHRLQGELLLKADVAMQMSELTPGICFHQALDIARRQQAKSWELRAATSLARLWQSQGKRQEAYNLLARCTSGSPRALPRRIYRRQRLSWMRSPDDIDQSCNSPMYNVISFTRRPYEFPARYGGHRAQYEIGSAHPVRGLHTPLRQR